MPRPQLTTQGTPLAALALALALCPACSRDATLEFRQAASLDLLARRPDVLEDQPGRLDAASFDAWTALRLAGWDKSAAEGAEPHALTNQPEAVLELPALEPKARTLRLRAWRPDGRARALRVSLNGLSVGELALDGTPRDFALDTPSELWRHGSNVLALVTKRSAAGDWAPAAVASVAYDVRRAVEHQAGEALRLAQGTGALYRMELPSRGVLRLTGRASGPGRLRLATRPLDPADGSVDEGAFPALSVSFDTTRSTSDLPLSASPTGLLEIELAWEPDAEGTLTLERIAIAEARPLPRPPIVFISVDTMAARHLSLYGYERETTPNLERLAEDAVVFEHCVANAPWTMPSYLSVMTGLYPRAHHVALEADADVVLGDDDYWQIAPNRWTLAEALRGRAYRTRAMVDSLWLSPAFNLDQGFDDYDMRAAYLDFEDPTGGIVKISEELARDLPRELGATEHPAPLFYFVHVLDAHGPYWPEAPYRDAFVDDRGDEADWRVVPARGGHRTNRAIPYWMALTVVEGLAQGDRIAERLPVEPLIARYDEALLKTDAYLGRIFDTLRERGIYDDALIVVSADHGESFAHDHYDHGELWEDVLHVPLVVKLPGGEFAGRRVGTTVQLVDLLPTVLDLLGLDAERPYLHGRSLVPLIEGEGAPRPTFSEGGFVRQAMVLEGGWKLIEVRPGVESGAGALLTHRRVPTGWLERNFPEIVDRALSDELLAELASRPDFDAKLAELRELLQGPYYELYELGTDPGELRDRSAQEPERLERMKGLLRRERERQAEAQRLAERTFVRPFSDDELEKLNDLGYSGEE